MPYKRGLLLDEKDNVVNLLEDVLPGETVEYWWGPRSMQIEANEAIPFGFKMAVTEIKSNNPIIKYGHTIGKAIQPVHPGALVHVHNLAGARGRGDLSSKEVEASQ